MKTCTKCKVSKNVGEFYPHRSKKANKDGLNAACKSCVKLHKRLTRNPAKEREYARLWSSKNRAEQRLRNRANKLAKAGFTEKSYQEAWVQQRGECSICGVSESTLKKPLFADHCHKKETPRGLLCGHCNTGLGFFADDPTRLGRAILYLRKFSKS